MALQDAALLVPLPSLRSLLSHEACFEKILSTRFAVVTIYVLSDDVVQYCHTKPRLIKEDVERLLRALYGAVERARFKLNHSEAEMIKHRTWAVPAANVCLVTDAISMPDKVELYRWSDEVYHQQCQHRTAFQCFSGQKSEKAENSKIGPASLRRCVAQLTHMPFTRLDTAVLPFPTSVDSPFPPPSPSLVQEDGQSAEKRVVLGGSFDHLHPGHKILLTVASLLTSECLVIGLVAPELLKRKAYADQMQTFEEREKCVRNFLSIVQTRPHEIKIVALHDGIGPAGTDDTLTAIVATPETKSGVETVNQTRAANNLEPLEVIEVNLIGLGEAEHAPDAAMTSTEMREWKLSSTWYRKMEAAAKSFVE